jgi:hypothetical protein
LLYLAKLKLVASLQSSEFPLEIPRSQKRNIQNTTKLYAIKKDTQLGFNVNKTN